jgi:CubicO group peptidase (beta-lactamase class C family)
MESFPSRTYPTGSKYTVTGFVKPGFEPVLQHFQNNYLHKSERRSQLVIYVKNEKVIDIFGKENKDKSDFNADSKVAIMSSGKSIAAILLAIMVDKGLLDYNQPVTKYWPEFGQNGKDNLLVSEILRHEGGLHKFHKILQIEDMFTENIKNNSIGKVIETDTCTYINGFTRRYHPITRDWISNEIFRRVEPQGRTMGEYLRE